MLNADIPPGEKISVRSTLLDLARSNRLACVVLDDGAWLDLGDPATLLGTHIDPPVDPGTPRVHPDADIRPGATIDPLTWIGPGASVSGDATLTRSLVFPAAAVPAGHWENSIILPDGAAISPLQA